LIIETVMHTNNDNIHCYKIGLNIYDGGRKRRRYGNTCYSPPIEAKTAVDALHVAQPIVSKT